MEPASDGGSQVPPTSPKGSPLSPGVQMRPDAHVHGCAVLPPHRPPSVETQAPVSGEASVTASEMASPIASDAPAPASPAGVVEEQPDETTAASTCKREKRIRMHADDATGVPTTERGQCEGLMGHSEPRHGAAIPP
jgi:hypothetical protein